MILLLVGPWCLPGIQLFFSSFFCCFSSLERNKPGQSQRTKGHWTRVVRWSHLKAVLVLLQTPANISQLVSSITTEVTSMAQQRKMINSLTTANMKFPVAQIPSPIGNTRWLQRYHQYVSLLFYEYICQFLQPVWCCSWVILFQLVVMIVCLILPIECCWRWWDGLLLIYNIWCPCTQVLKESCSREGSDTVRWV